MNKNSKPARSDGLQWHPRHERAAKLRAKGKFWQDIADELEINVSTAQGYTQVQPFVELVDWYRDQLFEQAVEDALTQGTQEALAILLNEAREADASRDRISAASKYLRANGYQEYARAQAELLAERKLGTQQQHVLDPAALRSIMNITTDGGDQDE